MVTKRPNEREQHSPLRGRSKASSGRHDHPAVLRVFLRERGGDLRRHFRRADTDRDGDARPLPDGAPDLLRIILLMAAIVEVDEGLVNRVVLEGGHEPADGVEHPARDVSVQSVIRGEPGHIVLLDDGSGLEERHPHREPQSFAFSTTGDDVAVVVREHHDGLAVERRLERPLARDVKSVRIDEADGFLHQRKA